MEVERDNALDLYQKQIEAAREISEILFEGTGRIETILLEQWRKMVEEQLKFFQATAAVRDMQGFAALHSAMFSHAPQEFVQTQRQVLNISVETQSKIYDIVNKSISPLPKRSEPLHAASDGGESLANGFYSLWRKSIQDALELAAFGARAVPATVLNPINASLSQKGNTHARKRAAGP